MELNEKIEIAGEPFPKPLPLPASELVTLLAENGFSFYFEDDVLRFRGAYDPDRLNNVKFVLSKNRIVVNVWRSIWTIYDAEDFKKAPLWLILGLSEIWVPGLDFSVKCDICGSKKTRINPGFAVKHVETNKALVNVNGQVTIVRNDVCKQIEKELSGVRLRAFDEEGKYSYLLAERSLRSLIISPQQVIGYRGKCEKCASPLFEMYFGPLRYPLNEWQGDDVVYCEFFGSNAYTPKAFEILRNLEKKVVRDSIILLDGPQGVGRA